MKLKDVKKGTRVMLKEDYPRLTKGMTGTILENGDDCPFVSWDNWNGGHNGRCDREDFSCWSVPINYLKTY